MKFSVVVAVAAVVMMLQSVVMANVEFVIDTDVNCSTLGDCKTCAAYVTCVWCVPDVSTSGSELPGTCVNGTITGAFDAVCDSYRWLSCGIDGHGLFLIIAVACPITLFVLIVFAICCCCWCCRMKSNRRRHRLEDEYLEHGGTLDPKEKRRQEKRREKMEKKRETELSEPLVSSQDRRTAAQERRDAMRAKYGIKK